MHTILQQIVVWTYLHPQWAGIILFIISLCETITVVGSLIPGTIVMTAVGTLIGAGLLPYTSMVLYAAAGAVVGDTLNFAFGYYLRDNISRIWPFTIKQHWLEKGRYFFHEHGGKSVFLGRFLGPLRAFIPVTAGALHVSVTRFLITDTLSALLWAAIYVIPGVLLGAASLELPPDIAAHFMWYVLLILGTAVLIIWIARLSFLHINDVITYALGCLWQTMQRAPSLKKITNAIRHYNQERPHGQLYLLLIWSLVLLAFVVLLAQVQSHATLTNLNIPLHHFFNSIRTLNIDRAMIIVSSLGDKKLLILPTLLVFSWLCYCRRWRAALHWVAFLGITVVFIALIKSLVHSPRPFLMNHEGSFPSGHTTIAVMFYGALAYFATNRRPQRLHWLIYSIVISLIALIMISRLFLDMHWLTDIIGGALLGSLCLIAMIISYQRHLSKKIRTGGLLLTAGLGLLVSVGTSLCLTLEQSLIYVQPAITMQKLELAPWWNGQAQMLSLNVTNRFGKPVQHVNVQWAGDQNQIEHALLSYGWQHPQPYNWAEAIQHPEESHQHQLHIRTLLFADKKPSLVFEKQLPQHAILVIRLWETPYVFVDTPLSLWAGLISVHSTDTLSEQEVFKAINNMLFPDTLLVNTDSELVTIQPKDTTV